MTRPVEVNVRTGVYPNANQTNDYSISIDGLLEQASFYGPASIPEHGSVTLLCGRYDHEESMGEPGQRGTSACMEVCVRCRLTVRWYRLVPV